MNSFRYWTHVAVISFVMVLNIAAQQETSWVDGDVQLYAQNGSWCWFQDERAVIDTAEKKLVVASANMSSGIDLIIFDLENMRSESSKRFGGLQYPDDHNAPGLIVAPDGNYIALWAHHYDSKHHYSIYSNGNWSSERSIEWSQWGSVDDCKVAYSNLYYLSDEERMYCFSRVFDRAPNFVYSDDNGEHWDYGSQLTTNSSDTYNKGYYKYWGNGVDRIDMCFTEEHPRDQQTSIYHGYIQDEKMYNSEGELADDDIYSKDKIPTFEEFTKVFAHGTQVNGVTMGRCWQHDICRYDDGTIVILFKARADDAIDDHRNFYARYDNSEWNITYLGKAGRYIYGNEHDYVGLGSVNPDDPNRLYLSTAHNPGDDNESPAQHREIWRGTTEDKGETWEWEKVTANSTTDNWRPIVPKWKPGKEALLWFRGEYLSAQNVQTEVVGTFYDYEPPVAACPGIKGEPERLSAVNLEPHATRQGRRQVSMQYTVPSGSFVSLEVFSVAGKNIATLVNNTKSSGVQTANWHTEGISAGTYLARLTVGAVTHTIRVNVQR